MKSDKPTRYTVHVGVDWADKKHDVCIVPPGEGPREFDQVPHKVRAIDDWIRSLHLRFGGPIAVAIELSSGPIISVLQKYDFVVIHPINPSTLAKYREAFTPSRAKDDPTDAEFAVLAVSRSRASAAKAGRRGSTPTWRSSPLSSMSPSSTSPRVHRLIACPRRRETG